MNNKMLNYLVRFCLFTNICFNSLEAFKQYPLDPNTLNCLKCICQSETTCDDILICAEKTIDYNYWANAGGISLKNKGNNFEENYKECMKDKQCIYYTIDSYIQEQLKKRLDVRFGGDDCKDWYAIHKYGPDAQSKKIPLAFQMRFNLCQPGNDWTKFPI